MIGTPADPDPLQRGAQEACGYDRRRSRRAVTRLDVQEGGRRCSLVWRSGWSAEMSFPPSKWAGLSFPPARAVDPRVFRHPWWQWRLGRYPPKLHPWTPGHDRYRFDALVGFCTL